MPRQFLSQRQVNLGANSSNQTGGPWLVADFAQLSVSIQSSASNGSRTTIIGTNDDGLTAALGTPSQTVNANGWSIVTVITAAGLYSITPGMRWINAFRDGVSAASMTTIIFQGRS